MEEKTKVVPVELLEKVNGGTEESKAIDPGYESVTDDAQGDLPEKKTKRLGDLYSDGN